MTSRHRRPDDHLATAFGHPLMPHRGGRAVRTRHRCGKGAARGECSFAQPLGNPTLRSLVVRNADTIVGIVAGWNESERQVETEGIQVLRRAAARSTRSPPRPDDACWWTSVSALGLAKSTARRLLVGLVEVGLASVDAQGHFSLGERLLGFGGDDGARIAAIFRPTIERVARATDGETVDLSILRGQRMWFVEQIESSHRLRAVSAIGVRFPLNGTANGKAALAVLDDDGSPGDARPVRPRGRRRVAPRHRRDPAHRNRIRPRRTHPWHLRGRHRATDLGRQRDRDFGAGAHRALPRKRGAHRLGIACGSRVACLDEVTPQLSAD